MGMIKLPIKSVDFFSENYNEIFQTGELAEGKWSKKVEDWCCEYTKAPFALTVNSNGSGLFSILRILNQYRDKKRIFLQSNTMYGVKTIAISAGLDLCGYVDCTLDYLMPTYKQVENFISPFNSVILMLIPISEVG